MKKSSTAYFRSFMYFSLKGCTVYRSLVYAELQYLLPHISGTVLDIAAGKKPLYHSFFSDNTQIIGSDIKYDGTNKIIDMNERLPFEDNSIDAIVCVNALYIVKNTKLFSDECFRILKPQGSCVIVSPFISNEMKDPDDFRRYTAQGLQVLWEESGFITEHIYRVGERFTSVVYLLHPFLFFSIIRTCIHAVAFLLDACIPSSITERHPTPLGYVCVIRKK